VEERVVTLRQARPAWGGRKLRKFLQEQGSDPVPAPSTITDILRRNQLLSPQRRMQRSWQRFEADQPNDLWQMDYKGPFMTLEGRCHPLTILDDHSRFNLCLGACWDETAQTVQSQLQRVFGTYGLPLRMLMDNGSPWGSDQYHRHTKFTAWLIRQGISISHGRPYHPQTQGKEERFHRTLKAELLSQHAVWHSMAQAQERFDAYRQDYNCLRPHQALDYDVPAARYTPSPRPFLAHPPGPDYEAEDEKRKVQAKGRISFKGREFLVSRAFIGETVALRASEDGVWEVYYYQENVGRVDLRSPPVSSNV
jgi:transposase InsO family protein